MGISGSQQAYQYAIAAACRSETTRSDYYRPVAQVKIAGTVRSTMVDKHTVRITDLLNALPNTATFECFDFTPLRGQEVVISLGTLTNRLFAGHIITVNQTAPHANQRVRFTVSCVDYTWLLETRRISGRRYANESVTNIIRDLMTLAPPGFTTSNVEASLDAVDFTTNHAETLMQAINRLMKMASKGVYQGGYTYVDYNKDLHAFVTPEADGNPQILDPTNKSFWDLRYSVDLSQVRTRVYVMGAVTQTTSTVPSGSAALPVAETQLFASTGGRALSFGNELLYAGTSPASGPGWLTGVTSFSYAIPQGESVRVLAIQINSNAASSMAVIVGAGDGLIDHVISDERLSDAGARDRGNGDLGLFEEPEAAIELHTRGKFFKSGKTLAASLTAPTTISAQFIIQEVQIYDIAIGAGNRFPRRAVKAGTLDRDGFQLLGVADRLSTEGPA